VSEIVSDKDLDILFRAARTHNAWLDKPVSDVTLQALHDLVRWGPTSANCQPGRFVFLKSAAAKERLLPFLSGNNREKTKQAPVCVIVAHDSQFYELIPKFFPHMPGARDWFAHDAKVAEATAFRNGTLQGAYLILAARALGLDCGPMSGFDNAGVDAEFFPDGRHKSNFLVNIGHGDPAGLFERSPRPGFDEVCKIL
jgi:3-hydroxypropanoate dehydrogenase